MNDAIYNLQVWSDGGVDYRLDVLPEDTPVEGNAMASDDDAFDREIEQRIYRELDSGNALAWCCIRCTATFEDFEGSDYLGCVSYYPTNETLPSDVERQCIEHMLDPKFHSMPTEALADLKAQLESASKTLERYQNRAESPSK